MATKPTISRDDLTTIAKYQKGLLLCILAQLALIGVTMAVPAELRFFASIAFYASGVLSAILVLALAIKLYNAVAGVILGLLTMVPCLGLVVLLIINSRATATLQANGISVGLLGARMSDLSKP